MVLTGNVGKLRIKYRYAGKIRNWSVTRQYNTSIGVADLEAILEFCDKYWITQTPVTIGLWMGKTWWVWEQVKLINLGTEISAQLIGNPIIKDF